MLNTLHIRDFAIIDRLELSLNAGLTVLTGETGAGKSILIDALNLVLGDRGDAGVVRHGCERAEISAGFDIGTTLAAQRWLKEHDLDSGDECLLRRSITREGRSKGFINGAPVTMQALRELGEMLVDIHGQHEHQSLLRNDTQRQLLDDYAGHGPLLEDVAAAFQAWKTASRVLLALDQAAAERAARLDLLMYQARELETLKLGEGEWAELEEEQARLANSGRLLDACQGALEALYDSDQGSIHSLLSATARELHAVQDFDRRLTSVLDMLASATIQTQEAAAELRAYLDGLQQDPQRLASVEQRLTSAHELARKHRLRPEELPARLILIQGELAELQSSDARLEQLRGEIDVLEQIYLRHAETLSASRIQAARKFAQQVTAVMQQLSMAGGSFEIALEQLAAEQFSAYGSERAEFLVGANPGQPLQPLIKVASGGELSRISLAIQVIAAQNGRIPTLIFDEVDVGIGGAVAEIVGQQLRALGRQRQVLSVTHLPQVAALGNQHLRVSKQSARGTTRVDLIKLPPAERYTEIARMLGGVEMTEQTLKHAREMVERAQTGSS